MDVQSFMLKDCKDHLTEYDFRTLPTVVCGQFFLTNNFNRGDEIMKNFDTKNIDCHAALAMTKNGQTDVLQYGRSMIEMLGVLAIIGVLSVGGIAGYSKAMMKYRINKTIEQITLIAGNIRTFFAPQRSYDEVGDKTILRKAKLVPDEMWDGNNIKNVWGGVGNIWAESKSSGGDRKAFAIYFEIEKEACIELITHDWTTSGAFIVGSGGLNSILKVPVSIDDAVKECWDSLYLYFDIDINSTYWQNQLNPN